MESPVLLKSEVKPKIRLSREKFENINQGLLTLLASDQTIPGIVKTYKVGNPSIEELEAHQSYIYTKEALGITKPVVAIRGTVASGKTTIIGKMCKDLNYEFIDNGSLFRAVTYYLHNGGYTLGDDGNFTKDGHPCSSEDMATIIADMPLEYSCEIDNTGKVRPKVCIDGEDISTAMRSDEINQIVPTYGGNHSVMKFVLQTVAKISHNTDKEGIIVGSRDYGTFMLSDAGYNFYFDAPVLKRFQREVARNGGGQGQAVTPSGIANFSERDMKDIMRENGSLRIGENAKIINTGNRENADEVAEVLVRYIEQREKKRVLTEKIAKAQTYAELAPIAMEMIDSYMKENKVDGMEMVCGPISTGGLGSVAANITHFNEHIRLRILNGDPIFDQTIFEDAILRIKRKRCEEGIVPEGHYDKAILEDFYTPIFERKKLKRMYFIPGRESSKGATRERQIAQELAIEIVDLEVLPITSLSPD